MVILKAIMSQDMAPASSHMCTCQPKMEGGYFALNVT